MRGNEDKEADNISSQGDLNNRLQTGSEQGSKLPAAEAQHTQGGAASESAPNPGRSDQNPSQQQTQGTPPQQPREEDQDTAGQQPS